MYLITKRDSETGKKFHQVERKIEKARKEQRMLAKKYGFQKYRQATWCVTGGFSSCLDFKETPDKKIWGKGSEENEFFPKRNSNAGKRIYEEFQQMTLVSIKELNNCIGFEEAMFARIGFCHRHETHYGIVVDRKWNIEIPKDCEEVTESFYHNFLKTQQP